MRMNGITSAQENRRVVFLSTITTALACSFQKIRLAWPWNGFQSCLPKESIPFLEGCDVKLLLSTRPNVMSTIWFIIIPWFLGRISTQSELVYPLDWFDSENVSFPFKNLKSKHYFFGNCSRLSKTITYWMLIRRNNVIERFSNQLYLRSVLQILEFPNTSDSGWACCESMEKQPFHPSQRVINQISDVTENSW